MEMMMSFGERIGASWEIMKACFSVLNKEKMLVLYPLISLLATGMIFILFFGFYIITAWGISSAPKWSGGVVVLMLIAFLFMYFCLYLVAIFSNVAIVGCAKMRLDGGDPTFADGFKIAFSRLPMIFGWALLAATVGLILSMIRGQGKIGEILASLLNFAWNVITYFVVPVMVVENVGPVTAIKRSIQIMKKSWGEALILNFGLGMVYGIVVFIFIVLWIITMVMTAFFIPALLVVIAGGILILIVMGSIYTALKGILQAALYKYGTTGVAGYGFKEHHLQNMFQPRGSRGGSSMMGGMMGGGRGGF
jgi:hypothetical protein